MWGLIIAILIAILIAGFASLNSATVSVSFFFWQAPAVSLALVVLFSALVGVIMASLFGVPQYIKTAKKIRELEKKIKDLESLPAGRQGGAIKNEEKKEPDPA
ncbi:MAG: LapA family protein [Candidatus Margulisbacteria bacterium]|nr:LapA family protein [Candidatus Margulisiibacteriota bacterium]